MFVSIIIFVSLHNNDDDFGRNQIIARSTPACAECLMQIAIIKLGKVTVDSLMLLN